METIEIPTTVSFHSFDSNSNGKSMKSSLLNVLESAARLMFYAVVFLTLLSFQLGGVIACIYYYKNGGNRARITYFCFRFLTSTHYSIIMLTSIYQQRKLLQSSSISSKNGGLQSSIVNTIVVMAGLTYFGVVSSVTTFYGDSNLVLPAIGNIVYLIRSILLSAHLIGGLRWAHITRKPNFGRWSLNWWASIYLLVAFCARMMVYVLGPWLDAGHKEFVEINNLISKECGSFVQILIMYICRPSLTIIQFRVIERLIHQLIHANKYDEDLHDDDLSKGKETEKSQDVVISIEQEAKQSDEVIEHRLTAIDVLVMTPTILFVLVFDLMSLDNKRTDTIARMNCLMWFCIYFICCLWSIFVIFMYRKNGVLRKEEIVSKHFPMFMSCAGTLIAIVGTFGEDKEYRVCSMWMSSFADLFFTVLQCVAIVLMNETKSIVKDSMPKMVKLYGKVVIIVHVLLICHAFLGEAAHFKHLTAKHHHDEGNLLAAMSFIFFFCRIEYHLAVIERVNLSK